MKSLDQHNDERRGILTEYDNPRPNGIACPKCGAEMLDTAPNVMLTSNPPQFHVGCPKCGFIGTRL